MSNKAHMHMLTQKNIMENQDDKKYKVEHTVSQNGL